MSNLDFCIFIKKTWSGEHCHGQDTLKNTKLFLMRNIGEKAIQNHEEIYISLMMKINS